MIYVFKSKNNNHTANQFFSTITASKNDLDPLAHMFVRKGDAGKRDCLQEKGHSRKVQNILVTYASNHKRNGKWPRWYRHEDQADEAGEEIYPDEQLHPSTGEHDENWDEDICSIGRIGLLIESAVWHGMKFDGNFRPNL